MSADRLAGRRADGLGGSPAGWPAGWPADWPADWGSAGPEEVGRALLAGLYPFRGGASWATLMRTVAWPGVTRVALAEALARLVAGSSVTVRTAGGSARYQVADEERARLGQEERLQGRLYGPARGFLSWCEELVGGAEEALSCGPAQKDWLERIALEQDNLAAGIELALAEGDLGLAARLASAMCSFWELRGPFQEALTLISRLLGAGPLAAGARARLLEGRGRLLLRQGHWAPACRAFRHALQAAKAERAQLTLGRLGAHLGLAELGRGRPDLAGGAVEGALAELAGLDVPAEHARAYATRALVALRQGGGADASADLGRALALQVGSGDLAGWATSLIYRCLLRMASGAPQSALEDAQRAAQVLSDLGDQGGVAACLMAAAVALGVSRPRAAWGLAEMSERLRRESGALPVPGLHEMVEAALARARRPTGGPGGQLRPEGPGLGPLTALARACGQWGQEEKPDEVRAWASVQALGGFQVLRDGAVVQLPPQVARLVKLLVVGGRQAHVEQAVESLWPEVAPALGRRRLRNVLSKLSRAAGPLVLRQASTLRLAPGVAVDALCFESAARQALAHLSAGAGADGVAEALAAHRLYSGELLPEDRYEDFAIVARERLSWLHLRLLDATAAAAAAAHDERTAEHCLRAALEMDPTDEDRYVALARHLARRGRLAAAGQVLGRARALLARLDLPVPSELLELEQALRGKVR
jgi:DNA-binding SARP family transcriptional activator